MPVFFERSEDSLFILLSRALIILLPRAKIYSRVKERFLKNLYFFESFWNEFVIPKKIGRLCCPLRCVAV